MQKNSLFDWTHCLNHIFGSSFPAGANYSLYHFYGAFQWSDKVIRRAVYKCLPGATTDP